MQVFVKKLEHFDSEFPLPCYESEQAAGADIRACFEDSKSYWVSPGERTLIPTGLAFEIPQGFEIQVRPRSGLSLKSDLMIVNSPGTIDSDYRGELKIIVGNLGDRPVEIPHGMRLAQLVLAPVIQAKFLVTNELSETKRNTGGFGHTGLTT